MSKDSGIWIKCPHCGKFYQTPEQVFACETENYDILFRQEDQVRFNLPRIPKLHGSVGIVRYVVGPAQDTRLGTEPDNHHSTFLVEVYALVIKQVLHIFCDQIVKIDIDRDEEKNTDEEPEILIEY